MSWTNELYKVYERAVDTDEGKTMLPISHSTAQAQVELTIDENGDFIDASEVLKSNATTVIPVTEDSAARSSGITPMPLADKLVYIAGDYGNYVEGKRADNTEYFGAYMKQLSDWCESDYSNTVIKAIYTYLSKKELMKDLIGKGVLELDEKNGRLKDKKIGTVTQEDYFVRFIISGKDGLCFTWKDTALQNCFIKYYENSLGSTGLCYAGGTTGSLTYKHPAKVRNGGDKSKLISANDTSNFTYRGRFSNKEEAVSVSYEYSQKIHNALKWLIDRERKTKTDKNGKETIYNPMAFDSMTLVVWNSALDFVPNITENVWGDVEIEEYSSKPIFSEMLRKNIMGGKSDFDPNSKVMVMGLDAATPGRLSISMYIELAESEFASNLEKWHNETNWRRFNSKIKKTIEDSCSLPQIANCLYGTEQGAFLECDKKILGDTILRLLPCVTERRKLPRDIVQTICNKASNPLAFDKEYNHMSIVENACALIRKEYSDYNKGEIKMAYDPTCTDRSYLFGCLLAIADKAERDTYEKDEKRTTNARRYWNAFSSRPYQTWQIIEERLEPYLEKESWIMTKYTKHINEIMAKMSPTDYSDNSKLSPMYLIGFHHYNALLWNGSEDNNKED
jgi:CRISPR-associated protein Csd1